MVAQSGLMTLRRPGIYFQEKLPPRQPDLPPLDVAAFVGFAEAGPVDTPVPVEDVDTFRAIFGGDLPVARTVNGELRYASLPAAVAGFFANGGRRCYVVRVTGPNASHSRFYLPGLVACDAAAGSTSAAPVTVDAASPGRWSTTLQLATQLRVLPLSPEALRFDGAGYFNWTTGAGALALESGDLLRIAAAATEPTYLITVTAVDEATDGTEEATLIDDPLLTAPRFQIVQQRRCFETATALGRALGDPIVSPTDNDPIGTVEAVAHLTYQGPMAIPAAATLTSGPGGVGFIVEFTGDADSEPALQPGDLLELTVGAATMPAVQLSLLLAIETVDQRLSSAFSPPEMDSPPAATLRVHGSLLLERNEATASPFGTPLFTPTRVERLRFDLLIQDAQQRRTMISDLGFDATHPRFWGDLILLESSRLGLPPTDPTRAIQAAARYRAMQQPVRDLQREDGPPDLVALAGQLAPVAQASEHYLPLGMGSFFVSSQADTSGRAPLPIVHGTDDLATSYGSTLFLDEALVPNPAAQSRTATTLDQQATDRYSLQHLRLRGIHSLYPLEEVALIAVPDAIHVAWTAAPVLEAPPPVEPAEEPPPDRARFHACITAPALPNDDGSPPDATGNGQTATNRDDLADLPILAFHEEADRILDFAGTYATLLEVHQALVNVGQARRNWVAILTLPEHFGVRHCRAWTTALRERLGLPAHSAAYRGPANLADLSYAAVYHPWHTTTDALGDAGRAVVANGPGNTGGALRRVPPDGAVCGVIAARALERGVWVAPANVPLQRVLGLQPPIADAEWAELFALGINLIRPEPLDFRVMSAHTLSDEREWLQLSVRRLLILLRKVALERGMAYVFENNDEQLRNAITLTFDQLLQRLFALGALAGATPQQGYRIVHDQRNNSATDRENGRFFVDIQVAPAQPLEFITVRLLRNTDGELQFSELT